MNKTEEFYCRFCAQLKPYNKLLDLKPDEEKCHEIVSKLSQLNLEVAFNENILPHTVCFTCVNSLERACEFVSTVQQAQRVLSNLVLVPEIKKEESDSDSKYITHYKAHDVQESEDVDIKVEIDLKVSSSKVKSSKENNKKKNCYSVDALPLSQINLTWKDYSWVCSFCDTQFPTIEELQNHGMQYHNACNPYRCTDCKRKKLRLDSFLMHVKRHQKFLKFSCYKCPLKFKTTLEELKHRVLHTKSDYVCLGCNSYFSNKDDLIKHTSSYYKYQAIRPVSVKTDSLTCEVCKKTCKSKSNLSAHILTHTDRKKDHTCEICGKRFCYKSALVQHKVAHSDARPYECEICKFAFKTQRRLRLHVGVHDGYKPFACDQCGKCFRVKKHLANHSITHTDSLPYVCTHCNKGFRFRSMLNKHIRQHTGLKPYSCPVCQREFTDWSNYNKHMKRKHDKDMAKKKHTPDGLYPIDPATGEVIYPAEDKLEWKKKMMVRKTTIGRPRKNKMNKKECKEKPNDEESNNN